MCILIALLLLFGLIYIAPARKASALDFTKLESHVNKWQAYFCRTIMPIALKEYYESGVLASITCTQACYEGGICGAPISVIGKNHFGVHAYSYWDGMVYDDREMVTYQSYSDFVNIKGEEYAATASLWRAFSTWEEGLHDHTVLYTTKTYYAAAAAATNYVDCANAVQNNGITSNKKTYAKIIIEKLEDYGFDQLDEVTEDEHGIFCIVMNTSYVNLDEGDSYQLCTSSCPETDYDYTSEIVWESSNPDCVEVDQNGKITAVKQGYSLISADYGDKEACCIVSVGTNAWLMYNNYKIYSQPDIDSESLGKLLKGQPIHVDSTETFSKGGNDFYQVTAYTNTRNLVTGYVLKDKIFIEVDPTVSVRTTKNELRLQAGQSETIPLTIYADALKGKPIVWSVTDSSVASVDESGTVYALSKGVSLACASIEGRVVLTVPVYVDSPELEPWITIKANYLRKTPVSDKGDNVYGTIEIGDIVQVISNPSRGWYRVLATIDGKIRDGYVKKTGYYEPYTGPIEPITDPVSDDPISDDPISDDPISDDPIPDDPIPPEATHPVTLTYSVGAADVDNRLNIRCLPSENSDRIATISKGDEVFILEIVPGSEGSNYESWYHIFCSTAEGTCEGYVAESFVAQKDRKEVSWNVPDRILPNAQIDDSYLLGLNAGTTVQNILDAFQIPISVFRDGKQLENSDTVRTTDTIVFYQNALQIALRTISVLGDVDGNGSVETKDYILTKRHVLGTYTLEGACKMAASVTNGEKPVTQDYVKIKRSVLGTFSL